MPIRLCLVRPPLMPTYHDTDIKEDPMVTGILGYLEAIGWKGEYDVFDFHLDKTIQPGTIFRKDYSHYVLIARDQGESYIYNRRLAAQIVRRTPAVVLIYGQVSPLRQCKDLPDRVSLINQSERELARKMGLDDQGPAFENGLRYKSYLPHIVLQAWQRKALKAAIETTRGCQYRCRFCFISAGQSFEKPWAVRPNEDVLADIQSYYNQGFRRFTFLDSEFLGHLGEDHKRRRTLVEAIKERFPGIKYMILCRGDTLLAFDAFDLLKESGLRKVLLGVESFHDGDLKALNKGTNSATLVECIKALISRGIHCVLTFITFNRNTTVESLARNLEVLEELHATDQGKYLGMPNFTMNLEISRDEKHDSQFLRPISDRTYLRPILWHRGQREATSATFSSELEPLVEVCRMLGYEWVVKKCELIKAYPERDAGEQECITRWFDTLGMFCVATMRYFLEEYRTGRLTMDTLPFHRDDLLERILVFYEVLPADLRSLPTEAHARALTYKDIVLAEDHGWNDRIPILDEEIGLTAQATRP